MIEIKIDGCVETALTQEQWEPEFFTWLESRGEYFIGYINQHDPLEESKDETGFELM